MNNYAILTSGFYPFFMSLYTEIPHWIECQTDVGFSCGRLILFTIRRTRVPVKECKSYILLPGQVTRQDFRVQRPLSPPPPPPRRRARHTSGRIVAAVTTVTALWSSDHNGKNNIIIVFCTTKPDSSPTVTYIVIERRRRRTRRLKSRRFLLKRALSDVTLLSVHIILQYGRRVPYYYYNARVKSNYCHRLEKKITVNVANADISVTVISTQR